MVGFYNYTVILTYMSLVSSITGMFFTFTGHLSIGILCLALSGLFDAFDGKVKKLVLIGQTAEKIEVCAHKHGFMDTVRCETFEEAIRYCYDHAVSGDAVLLSPACASWGMFPNYEERGRIFKEIVRGLDE